MMKIKAMKILVSTLGAVILAAGSSIASPIWTDSAFNSSEYSSVFSEDQSTYYLGPGYGGQSYDVEHVGLSVVDGKLYFGLQTGVNLISPATVGMRQPGDLAIDVGNDGSWDYGLRFWEPSPSLLDADSWTDVAYSQHASANPWRVETGTAVSGDYNFNTGTGLDSFGKPTYWLEGYMDLALLGLSDINADIAAHFTMKCGNDDGTVVAHVPEPATMMLLGSGMILLAGFGRKRLIKK